MRTLKVTILLMAAALMLMPITASAYTYVSVGVGYHGGYHGHYWGHGYRGHGYWGPRYYPFYTGVVFADPYYPPYVDAYYPPVVVQQPVVVERPVVVRPDVTVVPQSNYQRPVNYNGLGQIRQRKAQLLGQLNQADKNLKLQTIDELAGYSFDDQVKATLENILLSDPDAVMRIAAANSFGKVKNQGALGVLEKVRVQDSDQEVREAADKAITQIKS